MSRPHTHATRVRQPINISPNQVNNPRKQRELRNLQIDSTPTLVIIEVDIFTSYDVRRQVSPTLSPPASLHHYLNSAQPCVNAPKHNLFHDTSVSVGRMVYTKLAGSQTGGQAIHASTMTYTRPNVVMQSINDIPSPRLRIQGLLNLSTPQASPTRWIVPYTPNPTRIDIERQWESYQLYKS